MFRLLLSHIQALQELDPRLYYYY